MHKQCPAALYSFPHVMQSSSVIGGEDNDRCRLQVSKSQKIIWSIINIMYYSNTILH